MYWKKISKRLPTTYFVLLHPSPANPVNTLRDEWRDAADLQKQIYDLWVINSEDLASFINTVTILHKNIILSKQDVSPELLFEKFLTQIMAYQGFPPFLGTKYSDSLNFQRQCSCSVLHDKDFTDHIYDYLDTSMVPTIILTETLTTNKISPNIALSDFLLKYHRKQQQDRQNMTGDMDTGKVYPNQ